VSNFFRHAQTKDGYHSWCKQCCKQGSKASRTKKYSTFEGRIATFLSSCRRSAKSRNNECTITAQDLVDAWQTQGGVCAYSGLKMTTAPNEYTSVSVERIDSTIGYTAENTILVCNAINRMKSDLPGEVFFSMCRAVTDFLGDEDGNLGVDFRKYGE
jgi:hypothetical protein